MQGESTWPKRVAPGVRIQPAWSALGPKWLPSPSPGQLERLSRLLCTEGGHKIHVDKDAKPSTFASCIGINLLYSFVPDKRVTFFCKLSYMICCLQIIVLCYACCKLLYKIVFCELSYLESFSGPRCSICSSNIVEVMVLAEHKCLKMQRKTRILLFSSLSTKCIEMITYRNTCGL